MAIITSMVRVGQKPPKDVIKEVKRIAREAKKHPDAYDPDCPPSTPEALVEFAAMARERKKNKHNPLPIVALRIQPEVLAKYKALGQGYTRIMADVLAAAADNPEILSKVR
ncbi:MAG: BrnA antitoxin family protein [Treponema sp.]|nr:BrnA antitoxin family protein [Treponema sp.]